MTIDSIIVMVVRTRELLRVIKEKQESHLIRRESHHSPRIKVGN